MKKPQPVIIPPGLCNRSRSITLRANRFAGWVVGCPIIIAYLSLTACAQTPVTVIERVNIPTYIPTPATLTAPVKVTLQPGVTWGEAVGSLYSGLQSCNADKAAIASLKPPNTP